MLDNENEQQEYCLRSYMETGTKYKIKKNYKSIYVYVMRITFDVIDSEPQIQTQPRSSLTDYGEADGTRVGE